jgi:hypothetical protein
MSWSETTMPRAPQMTKVRQLDVGGEGRYPDAWNLNPRATKTLGADAGRPIPKLIKGRAEAIPLPDSSVDLILVERTPLSDRSLQEIARIAAPTARIILRHARPPWSDPHQRAARSWGPPIQQRLTHLAGQTVQESEFVLQRESDLQPTSRQPSVADRVRRYTLGQIQSPNIVAARDCSTKPTPRNVRRNN